MEIIVLSREDVRRALRLPPVIEAVRGVYRQKAEGRCAVWPSVEYHFQEPPGVMDIRSGYLAGDQLHGLKCLNNFPGNASRGLPGFNGMLSIFDSTTGLPLGVMDAAHITSMRTGAAAALGVDALARADSRTLVLLGAGRQAIFMLAATLAVRPGLRRVIVVDPLDAANAAAFARDAPGRLRDEFGLGGLDGTAITASADLPEALAGADAVITVTRATAPVIRREWVRPGTHFSCIGADMVGKEELDPELFPGSRLFADDIGQCTRFGEMQTPVRMGLITAADIAGELGAVLADQMEGRRSAAEITIFDATGLALLDLATGKLAIDRARELGLGTRAGI
jgi:alanine dehydrogenase